MTLRFIDFKTSEPKNFERWIRSRSAGAPAAPALRVRRVLLSLFFNRPFDTEAHDRQNTLFDVRRSMFDVRCSFFIS